MSRRPENTSEYLNPNFFEQHPTGIYVPIKLGGVSQTFQAYPTSLVCRSAFTEARGMPQSIQKDFLEYIPHFSSNMFEAVVRCLVPSDSAIIEGNVIIDGSRRNLEIVGEVPGGATRRLYFDDGTSMRAWGVLIERLTDIICNPGRFEMITDDQKSALDGLWEGPFDMDVKYFGTLNNMRIADFLKSQMNRDGNYPYSVDEIDLPDGRIVSRVNMVGYDHAYSIDFAKKLPNDRSRLLADNRAGPHQSIKAKTYGLLLRDRDIDEVFIALNPRDKSVQESKSYIPFPEYENTLQGLCAFAKGLLIEFLSPTKGDYRYIDKNSAQSFRLRLDKLNAFQSNAIFDHYRSEEFMRNMLVCFEIDREKTIVWMNRYGISEVLYKGLSAVPDALVGFDSSNAFGVIRALQALDPDGKIDKFAEGRKKS